MRVLQMPACGITHAAHSAVIKTPDFPQDSSPRLAHEKVTHVSKFLPPLHQGRKAIFLDRLNETMTAVSNEKGGEKREEGRARWKQCKGEKKMKVGGSVEQKGEERNRPPPHTHTPPYIFSSCSRLMSQHQTITLHSEAGGSIDSIFSTPPALL